MMDTGALFDSFVTAATFKTIQQTFSQLCIAMAIDPAAGHNVYKQLRELKDWKAAKLWKLLDKRVEQVEYHKQTACQRLNTLVIGAGPCGLRAAIECALLGSRVIVVEQRDKFSRNNVLHLWEFVIHDLKALGAKIFYPKFCTGRIEHISIRQIQCILLKVALCLGVQVHEGISFVALVMPSEGEDDQNDSGFRAALDPPEHILCQYQFDVLIGADGKRNTVPGFQRDEMRGKLAIAITANFVNGKTQAEERVPEISGVAYIFNQAFFKKMYATTGVDLENIVYYKDETHYFVMCAKKQSLLDMGVIRKDSDDATRLLSSDNVNMDALCNYARAAADCATNSQLPSLDFAKNHRGGSDIAMFDFTSLYSSKCSVRLLERSGKRLLMGIVGDSLHEPFWPTGSGCARGFLGVFDTAWLIRDYGLNKRGPLELLAERESVYRLLAQVTKENMHKLTAKYTIDPRTRYVSPDFSLLPHDVVELVNSDNPRTLPIDEPLPLNNSCSVHLDSDHMLEYAIWRFSQYALAPYKLRLVDLDTSWRDGRALSGLVAKFRPEMLDYFTMIAVEDPLERIQAVFDAVSSGMLIPPPCLPADWPDLPSKRKAKYIGYIIGHIRNDLDRLQNGLVTPRAHAIQKRKINPPIQASRRKTQPIERLALELLGCSSFSKKSDNDSSRIKVQDSETDRHASRLDRQCKQESMDSASTSGDVVGRYRTLAELADDSNNSTKRRVERLNPALVNKVENIISGKAFKEKEQEIHNHKTHQRIAPISRRDIHAMEQRLLQTGMGELAGGGARQENMTSKDEKIMRVSAADARKEAENGFTREAEAERFKTYDESIRKSEEALRRRDLTGIDPFGRNRQPASGTSDEGRSSESAADISQKSVSNQDNGAVVRPIAPVQPKRHSVAVLDSSCYDSVNARKQTNCQLCEKVVYLAERLHVEGMFIHRNCFRCAYCCQPLRLGEYGKDKDLEYHYPKKFFCNTHLRVPLREKIAGIERAQRKLQRAASRDKENRIEGGRSPDRTDSERKPSLPDSQPPVIEEAFSRRSSTLSFFSPEVVRERTARRLGDPGDIRSVISPVGEFSRDSNTPERAEFGSHIRKTSVASRSNGGDPSKTDLERTPSASESDDEEEHAITARNPAQPSSSSPSSSTHSASGAMDDEDSLSDCEGLDENELEELETTVLEMADQHPELPFSDQQVLSVIDRINRRRSELLNTPSAPPPSSSISEMRTPQTKREQPLVSSDTVFYTPEVTFRPSMRNNQNGMMGRERARTIAAMPTEEDDMVMYGTPSMEDIRKQKTQELEQLRNESRQKAKMKTDAELGLSPTSPFSNRRSVPVISMATTPVTSRSHTVSPPNDRTKPRASSLLNDMPSMRRDAPPTLPTIPHSPLHIRTTDHPPCPSPSPSTEYSSPKATAAPSPTAPLGMLSKLFSPDLMRKKPTPSFSASLVSPPVNADKVHCESKKEQNILGNAFRRLKLKRDSQSPPVVKESPQPPPHQRMSQEQSRIAAVAPSPRLPSESIPVTERTLKAFQRKVERIVRQRDEGLPRAAQETQRTIEENEIRMEKLMEDGREYERRLEKDPTSRWDLEYWLALRRERDALLTADEDAKRKLRKIQLQVKYSQLNTQMRSLDDQTEMAKSDVIAELLSVVKEKEAVEREIEDQMKIRRRYVKPDDTLKSHNYDYRNFRPVFSAN